MKIAISAFCSAKGRSGIGVYIAKLSSALLKLKSSNDYRVLYLDPDFSQNLPEGNSHYHRAVPTFFSNPILNIIWHNVVLPFILRREKFDLLYVPSIRRIPLWKVVPIVCTVHDLGSFHIKNKYGRLRSLYHQYILSRAVHNCDRIITVSQQTKSDLINLLSYPEERIQVIHPGVDLNAFFPVDKSEAAQRIKDKYKIDTPYLLYVSRIEYPAKNHIKLIKAFEELKASQKIPHQLLFVGKDWNGAEKVHQTAKQSAVSNDIRFLGFVPDEDLRYLYSASDIFCYPSLWEGLVFLVM